jgi:hypothetical protein
VRPSTLRPLGIVNRSLAAHTDAVLNCLGWSAFDAGTNANYTAVRSGRHRRLLSQPPRCVPQANAPAQIQFMFDTSQWGFFFPPVQAAYPNMPVITNVRLNGPPTVSTALPAQTPPRDAHDDRRSRRHRAWAWSRTWNWRSGSWPPPLRWDPPPRARCEQESLTLAHTGCCTAGRPLAGV